MISDCVHIFNPKEVVVITDASPYGIGVQLCNRTTTDKLNIITCASSILSITEQQYCHFEKGALSLVFDIKQFH